MPSNKQHPAPRAKSTIALLSKVEAARELRGPGCAAQVERVLAALKDRRWREASSLIRLHDALLFLRAFPQSPDVVAEADHLLAALAKDVARLRESGADMGEFDSEAVSGIAGTRLSDTFTYEVARWLTQRYPHQVHADWDIEEQYRPMSAGLPSFLPLLEDDCAVEADTPFLTWMKNAAGQGRELAWLLEQIDRSTITIAEKTALYDSLAVDLKWELADSPASRTLARRILPQLFFHQEPLIRRNQVSLAEEFKAAPLPVRKLSTAEGQNILNMCRDAVTVRYRELYGTTRGDSDQVYEADAGRGVQIFLWGLPPDRRLPLRAYHAGFTLKNGVPVNYIEGISLFEWMEIGFNTFYAYRDGETAWIYSKALHFLHQRTGVRCVSVYPYQLGHENDEAIRSGAFWFYRKLGFRPGKPELMALTQSEERKIAANKNHRTSPSALRRLAAGHVFYELDQQPQGRWDTFSTRNIGFAVQRLMAGNFGGNAQVMRRLASETVAKILHLDLTSWRPLEKTAFENFALVVSLAPEFSEWAEAQKQALVEIIRAKVAPDEAEYLRLLQQHHALRDLILRLGSTRDRASGPSVTV
jgi:hypothetical protein